MLIIFKIKFDILKFDNLQTSNKIFQLNLRISFSQCFLLYNTFLYTTFGIFKRFNPRLIYLIDLGFPITWGNKILAQEMSLSFLT